MSTYKIFVMKMSSDDSVLWSHGLDSYFIHSPIAIDDKELSAYFYIPGSNEFYVPNLNASS